MDNKQPNMKREKLLTVLLIVSVVLSVFSTMVSIFMMRRNKMQDELLQAMEVLVYTNKLSEDAMIEKAIVIHSADSLETISQNLEPQRADSLQAQALQADAQKKANNPAEKHPKTNRHAAETKKDEPSLHDQLVKFVAGESYVDLGLPSGTLWKAENEEGLMDFNTAKKKFKKRMPAISQWEELLKYCKWSWTGNGYEVIGPNGAMIFIPAAGYRNVSGQIGKVGIFGNYWSSTIKNKEEAWRFGFESDKISMATHSRRYGRSVRLVYRPILAPLDDLE